MDLVCALSLNYNQSEMTLEFVDSLLKSDYENLKIIIADNGSEKDNYEILKKGLDGKKNVLFEKIESNRGYVGGMNFLLEKANELEPAYYLVMNNDINIDEKAITELVKTAKDYNNACIVTGKIYEFDKPNIIQTLGSICVDEKVLKYKNVGYGEEDKGQHNERLERDMIDDVYWLLPTKVFKEIGYYSTFFSFNGESADYALRARKAGFKLIYCPTAKIWHKGSLTVGGRKNNPYLSYWQMRSTLTFRYIHLDKQCFRKFYNTKKLVVLYSYLKNIRNLIFFRKSHFELSRAEYRGLRDFRKIVKKEIAETQR